MITDDGQAEEPLEFPQQPLPTAQSVLWRPAIQELARPDGDVSPIFIGQRALATVADHLQAAPRQALLGFLVGRVFATGAGNTGQLYVVIHGAVRVPQVIVGGATESLVAQSLAAAQRVIAPDDGVVVGWYKSDPKGTLEISAQDHAAHVRHFPHSWQVALVMTIGPTATRGGFFRPRGEPGSSVPYLSFYELLDAETFKDGWKQPRVAWSNYWSPDPAVWRVTRAAAPRGPQVIHSGPRPKVRLPDIDVDEPAWRGPSLWKGAWHWWALAAAAVIGAVVLGVRIGLGPPLPPPAPAPPPVLAPAIAAAPEPQSSAPSPAPTRPRAAPVSPRAPEANQPDPLRQAIDGYRLRAKLFANHQLTCDDLAKSFGDVDEQWLHYTLAAPQTMLSDSTAAAPQGSLAAEVDDVEADFERSGCPRP